MGEFDFNLKVGNANISYSANAESVTEADATNCRAKVSESNAAYAQKAQELKLNGTDENELAEFDEQIGEQDGIIDENTQTIGDNNQTISDNEAKVSENSSLISGLEASISNIESQIQSLQSPQITTEEMLQQMQSRIRDLEQQKNKLIEDKEKLEEENRNLGGNIDKLKTANDELQTAVDNAVNKKNEITEEKNKAIEEKNKDNEELQAVQSERDSANGQIETVAGNISAQAQKNAESQKQEETISAKPQNNDEGLDYSNINGNVFSNEQLKNLEADEDKIKDLNDKLKGKGLSFRIDTSDGLDASELNMILGLTEKGNFGEGDKYSKDEIAEALKAMGVKDDYVNNLSVDKDSYTINDKTGKTGLHTNNNDIGGNDTKVWKTVLDENGNITKSTGEYYNFVGKNKEKVLNFYTYNDEYVEKQSTHYVNNEDGTYKETKEDLKSFKKVDENSKSLNYKDFYSTDSLGDVKDKIKERINQLGSKDKEKWKDKFVALESDLGADTTLTAEEKIKKLNEFYNDIDSGWNRFWNGSKYRKNE